VKWRVKPIPDGGEILAQYCTYFPRRGFLACCELGERIIYVAKGLARVHYQEVYEGYAARDHILFAWSPAGFDLHVMRRGDKAVIVPRSLEEAEVRYILELGERESGCVRMARELMERLGA